MSGPAPHLILPMAWDLLEEHLSEAAFLWTKWERSFASPEYLLHEATELEGRLGAHVDGLVLGGWRAAEHLLLPALAEEDPALAATATLTLLLQEERPEAGLESVLRALVEGEETPREGLQRALRHARREQLEGHLRSLLEQAPAPAQAVALEVMAFWQVNPGPALPRLLAHEEPSVEAAALRAVQGLPGGLGDSTLESALRSSEPTVRHAALETGLISARRRAWNECRRRVTAQELDCGLALQALALGTATSQRGVLKALEHATLRRQALRALGLVGTVQAAQACLELMQEESWARLAGEGFSMVTGLALREDFALPAQESKEPEEDQPEEELELPMPEVARVEDWWAEHARRFEPGQRYLHGRPFRQQSLLEALGEASMYRRRTLALELALRTRGQYVLRTEAMTEVQRVQVARARQAPATLFSRSPEEGAHG